MTRVGRWFSLERPPVLPAVSRGAAAAPHSLDDPPPGPFPDRQGRGKPPTPHPQLCLKSKAGIRKGDGLFSGILQRVCSWALFKNRLFPPKGKGEGRGRERSRLFRVAGDAVPPPRTPGTEILPDAPRSVVSATLREHGGGRGTGSLRSTSVHQAGHHDPVPRCLSSAPHQAAKCLRAGTWLPQFPYLSAGMHIPPHRMHAGIGKGLYLGKLVHHMTAHCLKKSFLPVPESR